MNEKVKLESLTKETKIYLKGIAKQYKHNIALTIQPNSKVNTIDGLQTRMGLVEDEINKRYFLRHPYKNQFHYIATIENNYMSGYHLHVSLYVPEKIKDKFLKKIESIIKHENHFSKSSVDVKEVYDCDGWISYITKNMYLTESLNNYFFNNQYNKYQKEQYKNLIKH